MTTRIPHINASRCSGCGRCIAICPLRLFAFESQGWRKVSALQDSEACNGCGKCATHCPLEVIQMQRAARAWPRLLMLDGTA